jgi:hypothetical protein
MKDNPGIAIILEELKKRFVEKEVTVTGNHPLETSVITTTGRITIWAKQDSIGFSVGHYTWTGIDKWNIEDDCVYAYYTSYAHPDKLSSGIVKIKLAEK